MHAAGRWSNIAYFRHSFIVLSHDLYEESVDMNVGYYLPAALNYNPPMTVSSFESLLVFVY